MPLIIIKQHRKGIKKEKTNGTVNMVSNVSFDRQDT
jgi:hypothetical protein